MRWLFALLLLITSLPAADLVSVQRELRVRRYYFGPLDGRSSPETAAALREFQQAKALDATGRLDEETLRALGLAPRQPQSAESRALQQGRDWLARYWAAVESGEWRKVQAFYAEKVRYYDEGLLAREELREPLESYAAAWPRRRHIPTLAFATWADGERELWITAQIRHEVTSAAGARNTRNETLRFKLWLRDGVWRAAEIGVAPSK